jgi:hypothetical protein
MRVVLRTGFPASFERQPASAMREGPSFMKHEIEQKEEVMSDLNAVTGAAECNHGPMLDTLMLTLKVTTDAALSRKLMVPPPVISKLRNNKIGVSAGLLVRIHDVTGMSINKVRTMLGLPIPQPREGRTLKNVVYGPIAPARTRKRRTEGALNQAEK